MLASVVEGVADASGIGRVGIFSKIRQGDRYRLRAGLRVFQGPSMQPGVYTRPITGLPQEEPTEIVDGEAIETQPGEAVQTSEPAETELPHAEPIPIDTTAELLGRAKPRKPRARAARPSLREAPAPRAARAAQEKTAKKPAARRSTRGKKAPAGTTNSDT